MSRAMKSALATLKATSRVSSGPEGCGLTGRPAVLAGGPQITRRRACAQSTCDSPARDVLATTRQPGSRVHGGDAPGGRYWSAIEEHAVDAP